MPVQPQQQIVDLVQKARAKGRATIGNYRLEVTPARDGRGDEYDFYHYGIWIGCGHDGDPVSSTFVEDRSLSDTQALNSLFILLGIPKIGAK